MGSPVVREVTDNETVERLYSLRTEVFVVEQKVATEEEFDGLDGSAMHVGAFLDGDLVGCGRVRFVGGRAKLERIAVRSPFRGRGIGGAIVRFMIDIAERRGYHDLYLHSQTAVVGFYEKYGFVPEGDVFLEAEIPHRKMVLGRS